MTKVVISQPTYMPWLGYFQQIKNSDVFVFLDNVQYERRSWQSRNRIIDSSGSLLWLSVPVQNNSFHAKIQDMYISAQNTSWQKKHIKSIITCLGKTPYLDDVISLIDGCFSFKDERLADLNIRLIKSVCERLKIDSTFYKASDLNIEGTREHLLLNTCKYFCANQYYTSAGSAIYLEDSRHMFEAEGITIKYQDWSHPVYKQNNTSFVSHLSWIDAVGHLGFEDVAKLLSQP